MNYEEARKKLIDVATGMIEGDIHLIEGCRQISSLRHDLELSEDDVFMPFRGVDSETDHYPLGEARQMCDPDYLKRIDSEIEQYLAVVSPSLMIDCKKIIDRFS